MLDGRYTYRSNLAIWNGYRLDEYSELGATVYVITKIDTGKVTVMANLVNALHVFNSYSKGLTRLVF